MSLTFALVTPDSLLTTMMESLGYAPAELPVADIHVYPGGEDVSPWFYHAEAHPSTYCNLARDRKEARVFKTYHEKVKVGVCRGGQFLNVMNRGRMYQDVSNHTRSHELLYVARDGITSRYRVTSTHHQMMIPTKNSFVWGSARESTYRDRTLPLKSPVDFRTDREDTEIVFYPKTKSLCFQPHPEYRTPDQTLSVFKDCLDRVLDAVTKG